MPHASERFASLAGWALDAAAGNRDGERSRHQPTSNEVTPDTRSSGTSGGARPACMRAVSKYDRHAGASCERDRGSLHSGTSN